MLEESHKSISEELKAKLTIIEILKSDSSNLQEQLSKHDDLNKTSDLIYPKTHTKKMTSKVQNYEIQTANRFASLSVDDLVCEPATHMEVEAEVHRANLSAQAPHAKRNTPLSSSKSKICVLADSHGKYLYRELTSLAGNYNVSVLAKSGAKLKTVVKEGLPFAGNVTNKDYVVLHARTNDVDIGEPRTFTVVQGMRDILSWQSTSNLIVLDIPYRYDKFFLNNDIYYINGHIKKLISDYKGPLLSCSNQ